MRKLQSSIAPLLFSSGFCALIYQVVWQRELRLVFGASTAASAAVIAIFIAGLGLGGLILGRRIDNHPRPLLFYAQLEALIATSALLTPLLLWLVRMLYIATGGVSTLGMPVATVTRLVLSALVLAIPTFLMGGTLPAAVRSITAEDDLGRRDLARLYGINTLGAVFGSLVSTFFLLEIYGSTKTLVMAALFNALVAYVAWRLAQSSSSVERRIKHDTPRTAEPMLESSTGVYQLPIPVWFVPLAAAMVGAAFFLMEIVWYRMLGPLLGGSVFTFGLILSTALFGIGLGGYWQGGRDKTISPSLKAFAATCLLEAVCIAIPFALGDRLAILTVLLRPLGAMGFVGYMVSWSVVAALVILPAAFIAGVQFPLLVAVKGRGRHQVGQDLGNVYAWNTAGAIVGSLLGGFGLLPLLTAPGCWQLVAYVLVGLAILALVLDLYGQRKPESKRPNLGVKRKQLKAQLKPWRPVVLAALASLTAVLLLQQPGPTALWRHSPIGAGRVNYRDIDTPNSVRHWANGQRRNTTWEAEGIESSVAMQYTGRGMAFLVNGKVDGNFVGDAGTQIMCGMVGAILHEQPESALVIGLGTGSSAGWLGKVPSIKHVDVVELEPSIKEVAKRAASVNQNVLDNPKVSIHIGDAREALLTSKRHYDIIFSEPSNPYRAGIASLYTREYYEAAFDRLNDDGLFLQWIQTYEIDAKVVRAVYATLGTVFPHVDTWITQSKDVLLVASKRALHFDFDKINEKIKTEPFAEALRVAWRTSTVEGFMAHFIANSNLTHSIVSKGDEMLNTDDHTWIEFGFARGITQSNSTSLEEMHKLAKTAGWDKPKMFSGSVNWARIDEQRLAFQIETGETADINSHPSADARQRLAALSRVRSNNYHGAWQAWSSQQVQSAPLDYVDMKTLATFSVYLGHEGALTYIEQVRMFDAPAADLLLTRYHLRTKSYESATTALLQALATLRQSPWSEVGALQSAFQLVQSIARADASLGQQLLTAISEPFAGYAGEAQRLLVVSDVATLLGFPSGCASVFAALEPHVPWTHVFLLQRARCYKQEGLALAHQADADLALFLRNMPTTFAAGLEPERRTESSQENVNSGGDTTVNETP